MARVAAVVAMLPVVLGGSLRSTNTLHVARNGVSRNLSGFQEVGCYKDTRDRIFQKSTKRDDLDTTVCANYCSDYPYYGLQNGNECWCGDSESDYDRHGEADNCNTDCSGNNKIHCGGHYAMQVFSKVTTPTEDYPCYADDKHDRVGYGMVKDRGGMNYEVCTAYCEQLGASWALVEYGHECFCADAGTELDRLGSASCDFDCEGDDSQTCGGRDAFNAIAITPTTPNEIYECYADDRHDRVGDRQLKDNKMTYELCTEHCNGYDAAWALVQYGEECFCAYADTEIDRLGSAKCDFRCDGDSSQLCGGRDAFNAIPLSGTGVPTTVDPVEPGPDRPTSSPTDVETIPTSCTGAKTNIRWASGTGLAGRMYMEDGGCGTMTDLYKTRVESDGWTAKGPIYVLDENYDIIEKPTEFTGRWLLTSELHVLRGSVFYCRGKDSKDGDGDCDELRIQSTGPTDFHEVRGHGGSLYFENTIVTSWDTPNKKVQEVHAEGRSFLNCVTEYESDETCAGQPKNDYGWCRMDIINSEMGHLGWYDSESYGLTWKVRGFCQDKSNPEVFDTSNVYGDIIGSDIHHMYYGMYSYGHQGGVWTDNKMHDNYQYGFDPHDDSDYLTIARNKVYNNVNHGIIASKRCNNVDIYDNEVFDGGEKAAGIFLHRSSDYARVYNNVIYNMKDAGIAMLESFNAEIYDNDIRGVKYGIRISLGGGDNYVHDNLFEDCYRYGLYTYKGSDAPEETDDGRPGENTFENNKVFLTEVGVKIKEADNTVIKGCTFTGTKELEFFDAQATEWSNNVLPDDGDLCTKNVSSDKGVTVPKSTFTASTGLPPDC